MTTLDDTKEGDTFYAIVYNDCAIEAPFQNDELLDKEYECIKLHYDDAMIIKCEVIRK